MVEWPPHVAFAVKKKSYEYPETDITAFMKRWGGLERNHFIQALLNGQGDNRLLALLAISYDDVPETYDLLAPFLTSVQPKERWISALCLGRLRDERSIPVLQMMLTEFLPPYVPYIHLKGYEPWIDWFFEDRRPVIVRILDAWRRSELVPVFLDVLKELLQQEEFLGKKTALGRSWRLTQCQLVHTLGRFGMFDFIHEYSISHLRFRCWQVLLCLGVLQVYGDDADFF